MKAEEPKPEPVVVAPEVKAEVVPIVEPQPVVEEKLVQPEIVVPEPVKASEPV